MPGRITLLAIVTAGLLAGSAIAQDAPPPASQGGQTGTPPRVTDPDRPDDPRFGVLTPVPENGGIPPIYDVLSNQTPEDIAYRARERDYAKQITVIRNRYLKRRSPKLREQGFGQLREFTDPASFLPMMEIVRDLDGEVVLTVLDHLATQGDAGQWALAKIFIHESDLSVKNEALNRMTSPAAPPVLAVLDRTLRSPNHAIASSAGALAGALNVLQAIPLMIQAQSAPVSSGEGDLAWIAVNRQTAYVSQLIPVVGDNSGAFQPVVSILNEGFVFRVVDAVVIIYRTPIHYSLVAMTSADWGESTSEFGYDKQAWTDWYNNTYLPYKNEQILIEKMAETPETP